MGDLKDLVPNLGAGELLVTHLSYTEERAHSLARHDVKSLFMVRNPRDIVVSQVNYIVGRDSHPRHVSLAPLKGDQERLRRVILGDPATGMASLADRLRGYAGWLDAKNLLVRYEDLIGESGGGSVDTQLATLRGIFAHIGIEVDDTELVSLAAATFSNASPTFRRGRVGQWRSHFDQDTMELFEREVGELANLYGYGEHVPPISATD